ncbi:hypothetical protein FJZ36_04705 [Candidatus Poribacteria bacterium]|nr:hypothetical protein [Candidatus Poribacteria bacterium]
MPDDESQDQRATATAKDVYAVLRGDALPDAVKGKRITETVDMVRADLKRNVDDKWVVPSDVDFTGCYFAKDVVLNRVLFSSDANFGAAYFAELASFTDGYFADAVHFDRAQFAEAAVFHRAQFAGRARFADAQFRGRAVFLGASFLGETRLENVQFTWAAAFEFTRFGQPANFAHVRYWPDNFPMRNIRRWLLSQGGLPERICWRTPPSDQSPGETRRLVRRWLLPRPDPPTGRPPQKTLPPHTVFVLDSQNVDEVTNPHFKRYVADQQFIRSFEQRHRGWAAVWRWSSDYGRNLWLWAFWSVLLAAVFAAIYRYAFPGDFVFTNAKLYSESQPIGFLNFLYYSVVTFTTLGFGDIAATSLPARIAVMVEVIFGYVMLGGLISILANKLARRS